MLFWCPILSSILKLDYQIIQEVVDSWTWHLTPRSGTIHSYRNDILVFIEIRFESPTVSSTTTCLPMNRTRATTTATATVQLDNNIIFFQPLHVHEYSVWRTYILADLVICVIFELRCHKLCYSHPPRAASMALTFQENLGVLYENHRMHLEL